MATYKKFLIQQQTYNGSNYTDVGSVVDIYTTYKVACQEFPFRYMPETKELASRDWPDQDGEDTFFPTDGLKAKSYEVEAKFIYCGDQEDMHSNVTGFIEFITGRNDSTVQCLAIYDEYTKTGRRGVYVKEVGNTLYDYNDVNINAIALFTVKFKVTDPVTDVTLA